MLTLVVHVSLLSVVFFANLVHVSLFLKSLLLDSWFLQS